MVLLSNTVYHPHYAMQDEKGRGTMSRYDPSSNRPRLIQSGGAINASRAETRHEHLKQDALVYEGRVAYYLPMHTARSYDHGCVKRAMLHLLWKNMCAKGLLSTTSSTYITLHT